MVERSGWIQFTWKVKSTELANRLDMENSERGEYVQDIFLGN
jgi:hypothetical protein